MHGVCAVEHLQLDSPPRVLYVSLVLRRTSTRQIWIRTYSTRLFKHLSASAQIT